MNSTIENKNKHILSYKIPLEEYDFFQLNDVIKKKFNYSQEKFFLGHKEIITSLCILDQTNFASGSWDKTIKIWNSN